MFGSRPHVQCLQETELGGGSGILAHDAMQEMHATHFRSQGSEVTAPALCGVVPLL